MALRTREIPEETAPPRSVGLLVGCSVGLGALLAYLWSFRLVDSIIGTNGTSALIGRDAARIQLTGGVIAAVFAAASGLAGSLTACNVAAFGAIGPLATQNPRGPRMRAAVSNIGWLGLGALAVAAVYGAIGAAVGPRMPQIAGASVGGYPASLLQASVVFGILGAAFAWLGLGAAGVVPDPLARLGAWRRWAPNVVLGGLIGAFLVGRPFPLFLKLFAYAAERRNPLLGAGAFALQIAGNLLLVALLTLAVTTRPAGRFRTWLSAEPARPARVAAGTMLVAGSFTFLYWVIRVPASFGHGWWPKVPWN
jgi:hypothetical protein